MSELRRDPTSGRWVIIAPARGGRPGVPWRAAAPRPARPRFDPDCPFCPGGEARLPAILAETAMDDPPGWRVRIAPNKFPALAPDAPPAAAPHAGHRARHGHGFHEVIIESPWHDADPAAMTDAEIDAVVAAYRDRSAHLMKQPKIESVLVFRNQGAQAGASQAHPHAQAMALDFTPPAVRQLIGWGARRHRADGLCATCQELRAERERGVRIVQETAGFVALVPYAAEHPSEMWIAPKRHQASFLDLDAAEASDFAGLLRSALARLKRAHDDPPYNFVIDTADRAHRHAPYVHWRLRIAPDLAIHGGFELGAGMTINPSNPEDDAARLRAAGD